MRESIGTVSLLNFIIFFILLVFAFLMGTFSYYKAYKVNNAIVSSIEKYEGFNTLSEEEIHMKLRNLGYNSVGFDCGSDAMRLPSTGGTTIGYCIYENHNDITYKTSKGKTDTTDLYDSYDITTIVTFQFPIIQDILRLRVSSRTDRIYNFQGSANNMKRS